MFKTALIQLDVRLPCKRWGNKVGWSPNIGLCTIASEIKGRKGFDCDPILLFDIKKPETNEKLLEIISNNKYGLIGVHTVGFYHDFDSYSALLNNIKRVSPETKIVVGGPDSILSFNQPSVDFVVLGPGSKSFAGLAEALSNGTSFYDVPNLFFKTMRNGKSLIEHSGKITQYSMSEFNPFKPCLDWMVVGRDVIPQFEHGVILKSLGCYYNKSVIGNAHFRNVKFTIGYEDLFGIPKNGFSESARRVLKWRINNRVRGCSFCDVHLNKNYACLTTDETADFLLEESNYWLDYWDKHKDRDNSKSLEILNEGPINFLPPLLAELDPRGYDLYILIDLRTDDIIRDRKLIETSLEKCRKKSIKLAMCAIGFENFVQRHLDIYNKGTTVRQNVQAITILKKIGEKNKHKFIANQAPQFILFNPWITLDELDKNLSYMQRYKICDMAILFTASTLRCFRGTSIYEKAKQEGFLTEKKWQFWVPWRFKDDDVAMVYRLLLKMRDIIIKDGSGYSIDDYRLYAMGKAETEAMRMMIRTIKENRGVSKYLLERICMRNILAMVDRYMAHYPPSDTKFLPDVV